MLKKHMAACLVVTAFAAAPAFAQTSTTQSAPTDRPAAAGSGSTTTGSPAMQPGTAAGGASGSSTNLNQSSAQSGAQSGAMQGQFMAKLQPDQIMASELIGTRVMGANNESIGDINDVIVDRNGQAVAAVVGVGGFLGIGEKDVAVPFDQLEFVSEQQASAMNNNANAPATTGSTAPNAAASNNAAAASASDQPERVVLRMTKAQLQAAPSFDADGDDDNANRSTTGSAGTTAPPPAAGTAPKQ